MTYKRIYYYVISKHTELRGCILTSNPMKSPEQVQDMLDKIMHEVARDVTNAGLPFDPFNARITVSAHNEPKQND